MVVSEHVEQINPSERRGEWVRPWLGLTFVGWLVLALSIPIAILVLTPIAQECDCRQVLGIGPIEMLSVWYRRGQFEPGLLVVALAIPVMALAVVRGIGMLQRR